MNASVHGKLATVFGGSGFVGRHVVRALARRGWRVRAAVRRPDLAHHLQPMGIVGQIKPVQANLRFPDSIARAVDGADAVINLVGILHETRRQKFDAVHGEGARAVAEATAKAGIGTLVHMSAIGADSGAKSAYARSKAAGEDAVRSAISDTSIIRPSIVFGPEDGFFNMFASLSRFTPILPLIGGGQTRFQPVFVGDVAHAIAEAVENRAGAGQVLELGGPDVRTFEDCLRLMLAVIDRRKLLVPYPFWMAKVNAYFLQMLPKPLLTVDQVRLLQSDNVVSDAAIAEGRTLEGLGVTPQTLEAILPTYLARFRPHGHYDRQHSV